jgi:hypothetical protein
MALSLLMPRLVCTSSHHVLRFPQSDWLKSPDIFRAHTFMVSRCKPPVLHSWHVHNPGTVYDDVPRYLPDRVGCYSRLVAIHVDHRHEEYWHSEPDELGAQDRLQRQRVRDSCQWRGVHSLVPGIW